MSLTIAVVGDGVEGHLFAALAARLLRGAATVSMVAIDAPEARARINLPPSIAKGHRALALPEATIAAIGQRRYGIRIDRAGGGEAHLPYGRYGDPTLPPFIPAWQRARTTGEAEPLAAYSANAALMAGATLRREADPDVARSVATGWTVDRAAYRDLLGEAAARLGVTPSPGSANGLRLAGGRFVAADFIVDASEGAAALLEPGTGWAGAVLAVGSADRRYGDSEPFGVAAILSAVARLVELLPRRAAMPVLAAEYRRLLSVERLSMATADAALRRLGDPDAAPPAALEQAAAHYRAAALLPRDPQPWAADQWLSYFELAGRRPRRAPAMLTTNHPDATPRAIAQWAARVAQSFG